MGLRSCIVLLIVCSLAAGGGGAQQPGPRQITALVLNSSKQQVDAQVGQQLQQQGVTLVTRPLTEPLSQDILRQFHLVIMIDFDGLTPPLFHDPSPGGFISKHYTIRQNLGELHQYVEAGGGLFFSPCVEGLGKTAVESLEPLLGPWGVEALAANARDEAHRWETYAWTTNVVQSPVTEGVTRLYYPAEMGRWDDAYPTIPFALRDRRWQAVVRGMPGSVVARCLQYKEWHPVANAPNPPILAAVAQIGRGRVALFSINRLFTFVAPYREMPKGWYGEFHTGNIAGVVLERGDGQTPSDGLRLITNMVKWLAAGAAAQGLGTYTPESYAAIPAAPPAEVPAWLRAWSEENGAAFYKVLIGARSTYSTGQNSLAELATAARQAGYSILVMTEDLAAFPAEPALGQPLAGTRAGGPPVSRAQKWEEYCAECRQISGPDLVVIPGLDMADAYGNRLLLFGQNTFPEPWMLTPDGKAMQQVQFVSLGFGVSVSAIARPTTSPLPHHLFKFFSGVVVYTYNESGELVDDGTQAYQAQIYNSSNPIPLVVHEVYTAEQVAKAAERGHQLYVPADTLENAAWYMRCGEPHFWETPVRYLVTSGPMLRSLTPGSFTVESDAPISEVRYYTHYNLLRRWTPKATRFTGEVAHWPGNLHLGFLWLADDKGRTAISPMLRAGETFGYNWRCSDRQNFFTVSVNYPGTILSDGVNIQLPTFGTQEGQGLWPAQNGPRRGENLAPLLEFPYFSPVVTVTDAYLDQRYWKALWEEVAFDAKAPQGTSRSRVYTGRVRYYDLHHRPFGSVRPQHVPLVLTELELRLRQPVVPTGEVFPAFINVGRQPECVYRDETGAWIRRKLSQGYAELTVGDMAGDLVALSPGLRVNAEGWVGFAPPEEDNGALPAGHSWTARWVRLDPKLDADEQRRTMGLLGPTPFSLKLTRGKLDSMAYIAYLTAEDRGVAGEVTPAAQMPIPLTLRIAGVNWNWPAGVWQPDATGEKLVPFGVFERAGWARLDVTKGGPFYAGNLLIAGDSRVRLGLLEWTGQSIHIEANNPTNEAIETAIRTPSEITDRYRLNEKVKLEPGTSVRLRYPAAGE